MYILCCFIILISFCEISFVNCYGDIHIKVTYQNNSYEIHDRDVNLNYDVGDVARLRCIISSTALGDGKSSTLSWVDDYGKKYNSTKSKQFLELKIPLAYAEDGLKLHCKAVSKQAALTLYVNFIRNKTKTEMAMKKPSIFWILIITMCAFVGGSSIILIIWYLVSCLCKKKREECDTKVFFSENLDNTQNDQTLQSHNTEFTEKGISNQSEDLQNDGKGNNIEKREDSDRREDFRQNSLYITVEESIRHGSSTEC